MPAQTFRCLIGSTCVVVACIGKSVDKPNFISALPTIIANTDTFIIIDWEDWWSNVYDDCLCAVAKASCGEDCEVHDEEERDELDQCAEAAKGTKRNNT